MSRPPVSPMSDELHVLRVRCGPFTARVESGNLDLLLIDGPEGRLELARADATLWLDDLHALVEVLTLMLAKLDAGEFPSRNGRN